jgi:hypothetical protein
MTEDFRSSRDLARFIEVMNGFHDGFIKRFEVVSRDYFDDKNGKVLDGRSDAVVVIAHHNYPGSGGIAAEIPLRLTAVRGLRVDMPIRPGVFADWSLDAVEASDSESGLIHLKFFSSVHRDGGWFPVVILEASFESAHVDATLGGPV